jgi:hypothetical protein
MRFILTSVKWQVLSVVRRKMRNTTASKVCVETDWCAQKRKKAALWRPSVNKTLTHYAIDTRLVNRRDKPQWVKFGRKKSALRRYFKKLFSV